MKQLLLGLAVLLMFSAIPTFADELILEFDPDETLSAEDVQTQQDIFDNEPVLPSSAELQKQNYLQGYQQLFSLNQDEIAGLQAVLVPIREELSSIDTQIQVLNSQINRMQQLQAVFQQKMQELQTADTRLSVQEQLLSLEMKDVLKKFERLLLLFFRVKRQFVDNNGNINLVQLFVSADDPADMMFEDFLLKRIQQQIVDQIGQVSEQQLQLNQLQSALQSIELQLRLYQERVAATSDVLAQQVSYQQELSQERQNEQQFFLIQLEQAKEEQELIAERVREIATGVSNKDYREFPVESFVWPVAPVLGISAHFKDEGYRAKFGIDHNAIDIPTDQLTPIKAPLSGRVLEVHDAGLGYSYLQLGHRDGLSTVYGHVYAFKVSEGDIVQQGQVVALSGGALGTKGAGKLTTGPHLHFEVLKNGEHVDPLDYLPELNAGL